MTKNPSLAEKAKRALDLRDQVHALLAGQGPNAQGAAILDLLATWLAGHHPDLREAFLKEFLLALPRLIEANERLMFGDAGWPKHGLAMTMSQSCNIDQNAFDVTS